MADEKVSLSLSARVQSFVDGMQRAAIAAESLRAKVAEIQVAIDASLKRLNESTLATQRKVSANFRNIGFSAERAAASIEESAKRATKARESFDVTPRRVQRIGGARSVGPSAPSGPSGGSINIPTSNVLEAGKTIEQGLNGVRQRVTDFVFGTNAILATLGAGALAKSAVSFATDYESALAQLNIVSADSGASIQSLQAKIESLASKSSVGILDLTGALTTAIGTLPKGADQARLAFEATEAASQAAVASGSTTEQALKGVIAVLNTYGKTGITAGEITDKLFATFDQGGATVPQLSQALGDVVSISSQFGISIDEILGSVAVLTRSGQTAETAITNIRQAILTTARTQATPEGKKLAKDLGIQFDDVALKSKGLIGVLEEIEAKGGAGVLKELFSDIQGFAAAAALTTAGLGQVREDIRLIGEANGKTEEALAKTTTTFASFAGVVKNRLSLVLNDVGREIFPLLTEQFGKFATFVEANKEQIVSFVRDLTAAIGTLANFLAENGRELIAFFVTFKAASFIAEAGVAVSGFTASLKALGSTAATAGATASAGFAGAFGGGLKGLGGIVSSLLRSPTAVGLIIGAGVFLGTQLGEAIGESLTSGIRAAGEEAKSETERLAIATRARLKQLGADSIADLEEIKDRVRKGQAVDLGGQGAPKDVVTLADAFREGGVRQGATVLNTGLVNLANAQTAAEKRRATALTDSARAQTELDEAKRRQLSDKEVARYQRAADAARDAATFESLEVVKIQQGRVALIQEFGKASEELRKQEAQRKKADEIANSKGKGSSRSRSASEKSPEIISLEQENAAIRALQAVELEELEAIQAQRVKFADAARDAILGAEQSAFVARSNAYDEETARLVELLAENNASSSTILALQIERFEKRAGLVEQEIGLIRKRADVEIEQAKRAEAEQLAAFEGRFIEQELIEKAAAARLAQIKIEADADVAKVTRKNAEESAALERALSKATNSDRLKFLRDLKSSPLDLIADLDIPGVSEIAKLVQIVAELPAILNSLADFLTNGIADFVDSLALAAERFVVALIDGLPDQIERLLSETIPRVIERLVSNLPTIVAGLTALLPRIVFALVKSIPFIVAGFVRGLIGAGGQIVEALTTKAVQNFLGLVGRAFAGIFSAIKNFASFLIDKIKELLGAVSDGISSLFAGGDDVGGVIGRTLGLSLVGDIVTGDFGDIGAEDIPIIGGFFHRGGMIRQAGANANAALALAGAGAQAFASGGMVKGGARARIARALGGDDVPAILQAGEAVLSRAGVRAVGGEANVAALNRGQSSSAAAGVGSLSVSLAASGFARTMLSALIGSVAVDIGSPSGVTRRAVQRASARPPISTRFVRRGG